MPNLNETAISAVLSDYFINRKLEPLGKRSPFIHVDDAGERTFEIDLAIGPIGTPGNRTHEQVKADENLFDDASHAIDDVVDELRGISVFPRTSDPRMSWRCEPNPNPVYGVAIEIENNLSKYLLGSLLAASIAGRWGILIVPDSPPVPRWIETIQRMMHKGSQSPIPSNILIFTWPDLQRYLEKQLGLKSSQEYK